MYGESESCESNEIEGQPLVVGLQTCDLPTWTLAAEHCASPSLWWGRRLRQTWQDSKREHEWGEKYGRMTSRDVCNMCTYLVVFAPITCENFRVVVGNRQHGWCCILYVPDSKTFITYPANIHSNNLTSQGVNLFTGSGSKAAANEGWPNGRVNNALMADESSQSVIPFKIPLPQITTCNAEDIRERFHNELLQVEVFGPRMSWWRG